MASYYRILIIIILTLLLGLGCQNSEPTVAQKLTEMVNESFETSHLVIPELNGYHIGLAYYTTFPNEQRPRYGYEVYYVTERLTEIDTLGLHQLEASDWTDVIYGPVKLNNPEGEFIQMYYFHTEPSEDSLNQAERLLIGEQEAYYSSGTKEFYFLSSQGTYWFEFPYHSKEEAIEILEQSRLPRFNP